LAGLFWGAAAAEAHPRRSASLPHQERLEGGEGTPLRRRGKGEGQGVSGAGGRLLAEEGAEGGEIQWRRRRSSKEAPAAEGAGWA
jgi:hypothetical protein